MKTTMGPAVSPDRSVPLPVSILAVLALDPATGAPADEEIVMPARRPRPPAQGDSLLEGWRLGQTAVHHLPEVDGAQRVALMNLPPSFTHWWNTRRPAAMAIQTWYHAEHGFPNVYYTAFPWLTELSVVRGSDDVACGVLLEASTRPNPGLVLSGHPKAFNDTLPYRVGRVPSLPELTA